MRRDARATWVAAVLLVAVSTACGSSSRRVTASCVHNSECASQLVCALGYCVNPCVTSKDCPSGQRCVTVTQTAGGTPIGTACQAPEAVTCRYNSQCEAPLICGIDQQCRNQCQTGEDCPGGLQSPPAQICTSVSHLCVDPSVDKDYNPATNDLNAPDAGMAGGSGTGGTGGSAGGGGSAGRGGAGGHGTGGAGNGGGAGYGSGAASGCVVPANVFANVALGDANPSFVSGVAAANADTLYMFTAYRGPLLTGGADAGTQTQNAIFLQEFDAASGVKRGAAAPFPIEVPVGDIFGVSDVAIAPTGEIALLYALRENVGASGPDTLFAVFLASVPADGGATNLRVARTQQLESVVLGDPAVVWAQGTQQFIVSWKSATSNWFSHVRRFTAAGTGAGSDTSMVPTESGYDNASNYPDSSAGTSGSLLGVGLRDYDTGHPILTILGADGRQVGSIIDVDKTVNVSSVATGGTTNGFAVFYFSGGIAYESFVPVTGSRSVIGDGGLPDSGVAGDINTFSYASAGSLAKLVSDDSDLGGVGAAVLETNGAHFVYVNADGSKQFNSGAVLTSASTSSAGLTNFRGSFTLSLFDSAKHAAQATVSGCP